MAAFTWGNGGKITNPQEAARQRAIAEALLPKQVADNPWSGLAQLAGGFTAGQLNNRAAEAETAGQASAAEALAKLGPQATQSDIIAALSNPWTSQPQASVASALLGQQMERSDPAYQLDMQYKQAQLAQLQNPQAGGTEYFGSTLPYQDAEGNLNYVQLNKGGLPELPEGARWLEPTSTVNTGTAQTVIGRNTGSVQSAIPIDNMGAAQDTQVGKGLGDQSLQTIDAGRTAASNNAKLGVIENLLATAPQGGQGKLVQLAGGLGIPLEGLSEVQAAQAVINQMVPLQRAPGSGTMSDADLELYKASLPSIINQPEANQLVIATQRGLNDYAIKHADIEQRVIAGQLTPEQAAVEKASIPNPLEDFKRAMGAGGVPGGASQPQQAGQIIDWSEL